jgi:hypothetical protein
MYMSRERILQKENAGNKHVKREYLSFRSRKMRERNMSKENFAIRKGGKYT